MDGLSRRLGSVSYPGLRRLHPEQMGWLFLRGQSSTPMVGSLYPFNPAESAVHKRFELLDSIQDRIEAHPVFLLLTLMAVSTPVNSEAEGRFITPYLVTQYLLLNYAY